MDSDVESLASLYHGLIEEIQYLYTEQSTQEKIDKIKNTVANINKMTHGWREAWHRTDTSLDLSKLIK